MDNFIFKFEEHPKPKGPCPNPICKGKKTFRYYVGLPKEYGRCDRLKKCGYHNKPDASVLQTPVYLPPKPEKTVVYPDESFCLLTVNDRTSPLNEFLEKKLKIPESHLREWGVGSNQDNSRKYNNTVFIYRNSEQRAVNAKFIYYQFNGKRDKKRDPHYLKPKDPNTRYIRCLYGAHLLSPEKIIVLVESEKTAVIASYFYPEFDWLATGGNNGLTSENIHILYNREILYICDADSAGRTNSTIKKLESYDLKFQIIDLFPELEDGYDLADAIIDGILPAIVPNTSIVEAQISVNKSEVVEAKTSVMRFPIEVFSPDIRDYIVQGALSQNSLSDFVAMGVLVALSTAIGSRFKLKIKNIWQESALLFAAIVGHSGVRKSPALKLGLDPVIKEHERRRNQHHQSMKTYNAALKDDLTKDKPEQPVFQPLFITDATMESMIDTLSVNQSGFLYYKDEFTGWLHDLNRYNKGSDEQKWLEIFSGQTISYSRKTRGEKVYAKNPFIPLLGGTQPTLLPIFFANNRVETGLTSRLLFSYPDPMERKYIEEDLPEEIIERYHHVFRKIFDMVTLYDPYGNINPYLLRFSSDAQKRFIQWDNEYINWKINDPSTPPSTQSVLSKLEGYAGRLSLILQIVSWASGEAGINQVNEESVEGAIKLITYFEAHAYKAAQQAKFNTSDKLLKVVKWIEEKGGEITKRDLYTSVVAGIRNEPEAAEILRQLVEKGLGKINKKIPKNGGHIHEVFTLAIA